MAAMLGAGATPDESLRTHDVLRDQRRRESEEGVAAFLRQHLTAEEFAAVQPHLATHGWTTCRRLAGVTIEDLVKPTGDAEAERGLGLSVGAARLILAELATFAATFYVARGGMPEPAEVVQAAPQVVVAQVPLALELPAFPPGPDLPTRDRFRK